MPPEDFPGIKAFWLDIFLCLMTFFLSCLKIAVLSGRSALLPQWSIFFLDWLLSRGPAWQHCHGPSPEECFGFTLDDYLIRAIITLVLWTVLGYRPRNKWKEREQASFFFSWNRQHMGALRDLASVSIPVQNLQGRELIIQENEVQGSFPACSLQLSLLAGCMQIPGNQSKGRESKQATWGFSC